MRLVKFAAIAALMLNACNAEPSKPDEPTEEWLVGTWVGAQDTMACQSDELYDFQADGTFWSPGMGDTWELGGRVITVSRSNFKPGEPSRQTFYIERFAADMVTLTSSQDGSRVTWLKCPTVEEAAPTPEPMPTLQSTVSATVNQVAPPTPSQAAGEFTSEQQRLIDRWHDENSNCRGGSDPASVEVACAKREQTGQQLRQLGICYGRDNEFGNEHEMHLCGPGSIGF